MSDEEPHEVGSRRRRREIRESREREIAAERERESAVRRLSITSTADSSGQAPSLFDQETHPAKDQRQRRQRPTPAPRPAQPEQDPGLAGRGQSSARTTTEQDLNDAATPPPGVDSSSPSAASTGSPTTGEQAMSRRERRQAQAQREAAARGESGPGLFDRTSPSQTSGRGSRTGGSRSQTPRTRSESQASAPATPPQPKPVRSVVTGEQPVSVAVDSAAASTRTPQEKSPEQSAAAAKPAAPEALATPEKPSAAGTPAQEATSPAPDSAGDGSAGSASVPQPGVSAASPSTPFEHVLDPSSAPNPATSGEDAAPGQWENYAERGDFDGDGFYDEDFEVHDEQDEDGLPMLVSASDYGRGYQVVEAAEGSVSLSVLNKRKAKRRRRNATLTVALMGFAALVIGFVIVVRSLLSTDDAATDYEAIAGEEVEFEVAEGDGFESVASRLVDSEIVASREAFMTAWTQHGEEPLLQPGTFELREQMPAEDALQALLTSGGPNQVVGVLPQQRVEQILQNIADQTDFSLDELQELNQNPQQFGLPDEADTLEGYISNGEYTPEEDQSAEEFLQSMVDRTMERLEDNGITDEQEQWETIIVASLISAEANLNAPDQFPLIASAIYNRLDSDHPNYSETDGFLQIDAAVHYGTGSSGDLHFSEETRADDSNLYNTFQHRGLPPGPIAAPSGATIEAAANPEDSDYMFWVTVNVETGETRFNETYEQHLEDEAVFLQYCRDNPGVCSPAEVESAEEDVN